MSTKPAVAVAGRTKPAVAVGGRSADARRKLQGRSGGSDVLRFRLDSPSDGSPSEVPRDEKTDNYLSTFSECTR